MSRLCPQTGIRVPYLDCLECGERAECRSGSLARGREGAAAGGRDREGNMALPAGRAACARQEAAGSRQKHPAASGISRLRE